jgi:glutamine amidotransferase
MELTIIDYGSGNLRSAAKAFERAVREAGLSTEIVVTSDPERVLKSDRIVLPGVGAFKSCKAGLDGVSGMVDVLKEAVLDRGRPFLGICVGMQLMADRGIEHGTTDGLGWISGEVVKLEPADKDLKIPHMGWNELDLCSDHALLKGLKNGQHAYFVHSYQMTVKDPSQILASVDYGGPVTSIIGRDNMVGTQFHPEKSQETGLQLLTSFLKWAP